MFSACSENFLLFSSNLKLLPSDYFKLDLSKIFWSGNGVKDITIDCIENIVEKGEIAHLEQFHLFPQYFPKLSFSMC